MSQENDPAVRIVLGHFFFAYIHPYPDGNGRIGRFLMNVMMAAGHYPWTIIPVDRRNEYMEALEQASVQQNIIPFCNSTLAIFKNVSKTAVFANEVKQSRTIFNKISDLDCFANARKDKYLNIIKKMAKVECKFVASCIGV